MSLTKDTLELIIAQAIAAAGRQLETSSATLAMLPEGIELASLEAHEAGRYRFRGALKTSSLPAFCAYTTAHVDESYTAHGFVDQDNMAATVIFNLGTPAAAGHADDTATLKLKPTAAYTALLGIIGKPLKQQQLAEWLEDWLPHLDAKAGAESLTMPAAINAVRRMTIKASSTRDSVVGDFSAQRSAMDEIEAKSLDVMPTAFTFTAVPYEGLKAAAIPLRVSVTTGEEPLLRLRWVGEETQREAFADEFKAVLERELAGQIALTIGTFNVGA